ncbi:MAG: class I SAM-dependent methyltransferase [Betaproteobacteria bacterium]
MQTPPAPRAPAELSALGAQPLAQRIRKAIAQDGGWWPFERFMSAALYTPGLGYYSGDHLPFGWMPQDGSDFVTAPELSGLFGQALAVQVRQALQATHTTTVCEFGAGSGALAEQLLQALGDLVQRYDIVDLSGSLRQRQAQRLARFGDRVRWLDAWPDALQAVVVANEMLDALPVTLLHWDGQQWYERGVAWDEGPSAFVWQDRSTELRPPVDGQRPELNQDVTLNWPGRFVPGTVVEIHPQAEAFMRSLAQRLVRGAAFFIDYGFPEREYYHPQRVGGTLMCHRAHRADADPLVDVGLKDITAHVNFTGVALAAQEAGLSVLGYTSQARFLMNCGLVDLMAQGSVAERANAAKLVTEHEMGELFKVLGLAAGEGFEALGFARGDRSHTL